MGLLKDTPYNRETYHVNGQNHIVLRFDDHSRDKPWYGFTLDVTSFPLWCPYCHKTQTSLYLHMGSRYGQVGSCHCEFCDEIIGVTDHDNTVDSIMTAGTEVFFNKLYLVKWEYVEAIQQKYHVSIENALKKYYNPRKFSCITIDKLCDIICELIHIHTDGSMKFKTDQRFAILPDDINRWLELLSRADIEIPSYCQLLP